MCNIHPTDPENHDHQCPGCGAIWHHTEKSLNCTPCHTCPHCGSTQFVVHSWKDRAAERKFCAAQGMTPHLIDMVAPNDGRTDRILSGAARADKTTAGESTMSIRQSIPLDWIDRDVAHKINTLLAEELNKYGAKGYARGRGIATLAATIVANIIKTGTAADHVALLGMVHHLLDDIFAYYAISGKLPAGADEKEADVIHL